MPNLYMLVGVPGVGKSTWIRQQEWTHDNTVIVSTDNHVEKYALSKDATYNDVFKDYMPTAIDLMFADIADASSRGLNIIWDQTNTTVKSRASKLRKLPDYYKIAVTFFTPHRDELDVRLSGRPGKHIPKNVVDSMISKFELPTQEEGFDEVWFV